MSVLESLFVVFWLLLGAVNLSLGIHFVAAGAVWYAVAYFVCSGLDFVLALLWWDIYSD